MAVLPYELPVLTITISFEAIFISGDSLVEDSQRAANLAGDSEKIITDLETEFEKRTKLHGQDIAFLFFFHLKN